MALRWIAEAHYRKLSNQVVKGYGKFIFFPEARSPTQLNPAMILTLIARIAVLKKKDSTLCNKTKDLIEREVVCTSATKAIHPNPKGKIENCDAGFLMPLDRSIALNILDTVGKSSYTDQQMMQSGMGIEIAPDTPSEL
ncbi:MAG: hypothetical protein QQW96_07875 [Tychonema bourrellyi B0820]|uniref:hypothetical protein n=1 Tax=Tychonema bourrellyi TaxID=54313 RepID=UPI001FEB4203|nr:hypothetical protein [Tychonema bourrellyi]MDQ2097548.1 hypothetical protein [Tychonema bourrellyi B0820]